MPPKRCHLIGNLTITLPKRQHNATKDKEVTIARPPFGQRPQREKDDTRTNRAIRVPEVRLIDENGEQVGVVRTEDALRRAQDAGLDLVEVSPNASPPVCKILDYGKYKFQQQKKANEAKKKQQVITVKEVTIRPRTEENDYQVKLRNAKKFLERGDKVKFNMRFRGREITHQEIAMELMKRIAADLQGVAKVDQHPKMDGRLMVMLVSPVAEVKK